MHRPLCVVATENWNMGLWLPRLWWMNGVCVCAEVRRLNVNITLFWYKVTQWRLCLLALMRSFCRLPIFAIIGILGLICPFSQNTEWNKFGMQNFVCCLLMLRSASVSLLSDQVYNNWCSGRPVTARQQPCTCEVRGEGGAGNMETLTFNFTFLSFTTALESIDLPKQR